MIFLKVRKHSKLTKIYVVCFLNGLFLGKTSLFSEKPEDFLLQF